MKKSLLILITFLLTSPLFAGITDSLSVGFAGGYGHYNTFRGEFYFKSDIRFFNRKSELKAGLGTNSYQLNFDNVSGLNASSIGVFGDLVIYPFNKVLFTGIRWELVNFNWLTDESISKIEDERTYSPTSLYTGTSMFFQIGCQFKLSEKVGIKLYAQPGFQYFSISNGSSSIGTTSTTDSPEDLIIEEHYEFIYNVNLSFEFRIK